jgi:hypothetical protein
VVGVERELHQGERAARPSAPRRGMSEGCECKLEETSAKLALLVCARSAQHRGGLLCG